MVGVKKDKNTFYCFSPPVMIATFALEMVGALYVLWRYKLNSVGRIVVLILIGLATFQAAEFMVCEGPTGSGAWWSRAGYIAITLLPPLGLHLAYAIAGAKRRIVPWLAYLFAAGFMSYFLFGSSSLTGHECLGNYVIFQMSPSATFAYGAYYYILLAVGVLMAWKFMLRSKARNIRRGLAALIFGYVAFILPTSFVNLLKPETQAGIPSIMCGFAVLLAAILVFVVVPAGLKPKPRR